MHVVGVGACDKSCGHIAGERGGDMWQGWGHVTGCGSMTGGGSSGFGYTT